jgi:tRNA(fMet)-specific endonuclease VapC
LRIGVETLDFDAAAEYGRVRADLAAKDAPIGPLDTPIAARARAEGLTLVTRDTREFERVPALRVEDWTIM